GWPAGEACHRVVDLRDGRPIPPRAPGTGPGSQLALPVATMPAVPYTPPRPPTWVDVSSRPLSLPWSRAKFVVLACATLLAGVVRIGALDTYGFSEDEINKVQAIEQYRAGHFGANAEHPMLMKLAIWDS